MSWSSLKHLVIAALLLLCCTLSAETGYLSQYLKSYPESAIIGFEHPLHWQEQEWLTASGLLIGIGALYLADEDIRDFAQENKSPASKSIMTVGKQFGEGKYVVPAIGISILGGYLTGGEKTMDTGLLSLKSFVLSQCVTQSLKLITQRKRPSAKAGKEFWNGQGISNKRDSFPSGHSTIVWSLAPILAAQYDQQKWVAPTVYSIAALTSISRVHDNNHWSSDVFTGAVIGYFSARLVLGSTPRLELSAMPDGTGIGLSYNF